MYFCLFFRVLQRLNFSLEQGYPQAAASAPLTLAGSRLWGTRVWRFVDGIWRVRFGPWLTLAMAIEFNLVGAVAQTINGGCAHQFVGKSGTLFIKGKIARNKCWLFFIPFSNQLMEILVLW